MPSFLHATSLTKTTRKKASNPKTTLLEDDVDEVSPMEGDAKSDRLGPFAQVLVWPRNRSSTPLSTRYHTSWPLAVRSQTKHGNWEIGQAHLIPSNGPRSQGILDEDDLRAISEAGGEFGGKGGEVKETKEVDTC